MKLSEILDKVGPEFEDRAPTLDAENRFAEENFKKLIELGAYKAMIPSELGGGGESFTAMANFIKDLAGYCPSTSLTCSMHQHLIAAQVYKYHQDKSSEPLLRNVVDHDWVLLSTGGGDWISSNGSAEKVEGGYRITCRKSFCSGAPIATVSVMSCAYKDDKGDEHVLHFGVPMSAEGVEIIEDWDGMGMRGTGSHSIQFTNVFVADEKIPLIRKRGVWHPLWNLVSTYAHPIFLAPYLGVAEKLASKATELFKGRPVKDETSIAMLGKMNTQLRVAQHAWGQMVRTANDFKTTPTLETALGNLQDKSILTEFTRLSAQSAMEALGGYGYFRKVGLERLYRDLLAGEFHPLQAHKMESFAGKVILGEDI